MPETFTPFGLIQMETATRDNDWGDQLNAVIAALENMIKGTRVTNTSGATTTLTQVTAREFQHRITGALSSNAVIELPNIQGNWLFSNETSGDFTVTVKVTGQTGVVIPRGASMWLRGNGTDVVPSNLPMPRGMDMMAAAVGGSADALAVTLQPALTGYAARTFVAWTSPGPNTIAAPTVNFNALGALTIKKGAGAALLPGDTGAAGYVCLAVINGTDVLLLNPASGASAASTTQAGVAELATNAEALAMADTGRTLTPSNLSAFHGKGADIASASTITIGDGGYFDVTGTVTITDIDFAVDVPGREVELQFDAALTLTHSATLILPGGENITTAAGHVARFRSEGSDVVRLVSYSGVLSNVKRVKKTADESLVSTTVFQDDDHLSFAVEANKNYEVKIRLIAFTTGSTREIKWQLTGPASPASVILYSTSPAATTFADMFKAVTGFSVSAQHALPTSQDIVIEIKGHIFNGPNAGTVRLQWAPVSSFVQALTVKAESYLEYQVI